MKSYEPWEDLGYAIVTAAVIEYRSVIRRMYREQNDNIKMYYIRRAVELERFFRGEWCYSLCGIDGNDIITTVRSNAEGNRKSPPNNRK